MLGNAIIQVGIFTALVTAISVPLGLYMARVFASERTMLDPVLRPIERTIYWLCGVHPEAEETWVEYAVSMLLFSMAGMLVLYAMERLQYYLPLNPQQFGAVGTDLAFNTAASFTTNTNWQAYGGESTMSYFTQMAGLAFHNFVSAAAGIAVAIAVIRGFVRRSAKDHRKFLGRHDAGGPVGATADQYRRRIGAGMAGSPAKFQPLHACENLRGR